MKAKIVCLAMGLFLAALAVFGAENDRFKGGSYDGWGQAETEYASLRVPPVPGTIFKVY